ncbi:MAG: tyrosine-protein phosphatase [Polyangiales bacterium]
MTAPPTADGAATSGEPVFVGHLVNARDMGGIRLGALGSAAHVRPRTLYRGPPLARLTADGCSELAERGIRSVIDLRVQSEVNGTPEAPCVAEHARWVHAPLPIPYGVSAQDYIADLDASASIATAFSVLSDPAAYPVYFHCTWGRDRTGILAAVILLALGAEREAIMEDYLISLMTVGAYPMSLAAALDEIATRGGVEVYLAASGVSADQIHALREQLIAPPR